MVRRVFTPFLLSKRIRHTRVLALGSCLEIDDGRRLEVEIRKGGEDLMLNSLVRPPGLS